MKLAAAFFLAATALSAQSISVGIRAGVPFNDVLSANSNFTSTPHHWTFGPTLEIRLPLNLGFTFDALYSQLEYQSNTPFALTAFRGGNWDFPVMLRYRFKALPLIRPYVAGGGSFNKLTGFTTPTSSARGMVFGGGVEIKALLIRISPELRWTHRFGDNFNITGLKTAADQATFLVGVTF